MAEWVNRKGDVNVLQVGTYVDREKKKKMDDGWRVRYRSAFRRLECFSFHKGKEDMRLSTLPSSTNAVELWLLIISPSLKDRQATAVLVIAIWTSRLAGNV
jgi:hypothetical protein